MIKSLVWERHDDASYAWPLGLHYYTEVDDDGGWPPACMIGDTDVWAPIGPSCKTRAEAERLMQEHFAQQVMEWVEFPKNA